MPEYLLPVGLPPARMTCTAGSLDESSVGYHVAEASLPKKQNVALSVNLLQDIGLGGLKSWSSAAQAFSSAL